MNSAQEPDVSRDLKEVAGSDVPVPVVLIIADISGYTRYMTANARSLSHSQAIITELIKVIVKQVELPLEVAKLEGDAVFLYGRKPADPAALARLRRVIGEKLRAFFDAFRSKVGELSQATTCTCHACAHIENLRLKLIVHSGEALFHRVLNFEELAGVDVIIAHRLLKNSVDADEYLLLTEAAHHDIDLSAEIHLTPGSEAYEDLGRIRTFVYKPGSARPVSSGVTFSNSWELFRKLWFAPLGRVSGRGASVFHHVEPAVSQPARAGFAALTLLLTPLFLPAGFLVAFLHSRRKTARHEEHVHTADGSCCRDVRDTVAVEIAPAEKFGGGGKTPSTEHQAPEKHQAPKARRLF